MKRFFRNYLTDSRGAAAAEYALILAIVGAGIAVAAIALGHAISNAMDSASTLISNPSGTSAS